MQPQLDILLGAPSFLGLLRGNTRRKIDSKMKRKRKTQEQRGWRRNIRKQRRNQR
jgi:hypothetical protein